VLAALPCAEAARLGRPRLGQTCAGVLPGITLVFKPNSAVGHAEPDDRVFIFGMQAGVYFETGLLPAERFLWVGPAVEGLLPHPAFTLERLPSDLAASRRRFIIREANNGDSLLGWRVQTRFAEPPMLALLESYEPVATIADFTIYQRRAPE